MTDMPIVGQLVHYWPAEYKDAAQPFAAIVTYVHSDTLVNLVVFLPNGEHALGRMNVEFIGAADARPADASYATRIGDTAL